MLGFVSLAVLIPMYKILSNGCSAFKSKFILLCESFHKIHLWSKKHHLLTQRSDRIPANRPTTSSHGGNAP